MFNNIYKGKSVLITGHTGFKGSWLTYWLNKLEANITGYALSPINENDSHLHLLDLAINDVRGDIRNIETLTKIINDTNPEIIFHLAAQPLVRISYDDPIETWSTNVMGTANLLNICRNCNSLKAIVIITTDKVYQNNEWEWGYRENDRLGGHDPYSASKAATELLVNSFQKSFYQENKLVKIVTARAGNVIGGGDWSIDRLIPDLVKSAVEKKPIKIRYPNATRPWQHVLDCLSGYLLLGQHLLEDNNKITAGAWNFGPNQTDNRRVSEVLDILKSNFNEINWIIEKDINSLHEAEVLYLDSSKSRSKLEWETVWSLNEAVKYTSDWYRSYCFENKLITDLQFEAYLNDASKKNIIWL